MHFRRIIFYPCHSDAVGANIFIRVYAHFEWVCVSHKCARFCEQFLLLLFSPHFSIFCPFLSFTRICFRYYCSGKQQKCYSILSLINIFDFEMIQFFVCSFSRRNIIGVSCCIFISFLSRRFSFLDWVCRRPFCYKKKKNSNSNNNNYNNGMVLSRVTDLKIKFPLSTKKKSLTVWNHQVQKLNRTRDSQKCVRACVCVCVQKKKSLFLLLPFFVK